MDELNGQATMIPDEDASEALELLRSEARALSNVMQALQVLFVGHQITHQVLGGIIRHLVTGQPIKLSKQAWEAVGIQPQDASSIVVVPPGVKLAS